MSDIMQMSEKYTFNTYARYKIVVDRASEGYLIDKNGKKYVDFMAGIAVNSLGYDDEGFKETLKKQIDKILHCSNLYYNEPQASLAQALCQNSKGDFEKVFFCNSGTEANEGAIKLARLWGKKKCGAKKGECCSDFVAFKNSFHGRSTGALSLTGQTKYQKGFEPLIGEVKYAEFNDFRSVKEAVDEKTCAVILEPIQGEGGIITAEPEFLKSVRKLCDEKNVMLIFDEVQTGIGRTGKLFAYQNFDIIPDVLTLAKGLGNGMPIGAILANKKFSEIFEPSTHGTTFGGNPLAMAAGLYVINKISKPEFLKSVDESAQYFVQKLNEIVKKHKSAKILKGKGLMLGLEVEGKPADYVKKCVEEGLLILSAGENVLRFVPPLTITKERIDEGVKILDKVFSKMENK